MPPIICTSKWRMAKGALGGLADRGEGRNQKIVEGLAGGQFGPETCGFGLQVSIREGGKFGFQRVDFLDGSAIFGDFPVVGCAEEFCRD